MAVKLNIFDLLSKRTIQNFRSAFLKVANMQISFADTEHIKYNTYYSEKSHTEFCSILNDNPDTLKCCLKCSKIGGKEAFRKGKTLIYECHAGLKEIVVPIIVNAEHIGSVYSGQIMTAKPSETQIDAVVRRYAVYGLDEGMLRTAYNDIPIISEESVEMIADMLSVIVDYIVETEINILLNNSIQEEQQKLKDTIPYVLNEFVGLVIRDDSDGLLEVKAKMQQLNLEHEYDLLIYLQIDAFDQFHFEGGDKLKVQVIDSVKAVLDETVAAYKCMLLQSINKGRFVLFCGTGHLKTDYSRKKYATKLAEKLVDVVGKKTAFTVTAGISRPMRWFVDLGKAYRQAKVACISGIMVGEGSVLHIDDVMPDSEHSYSPISDEKIRRCIVMADAEALLKMYEADFKRVLGMKTGNIDQIKSIQIEFLDRMLSAAQEQGIIDDVSAQKLTLFNEVLLLDKEHELYYWMRRKILDFAEQINDMRRSRNKELIGKAKAYIDQHFSAGISLEDVAAYVYLSPNYFGWLFKKEVGITYIDYLTKLRMEKAKYMLRSSHKTIHSIALELGYNDPNYFSQVFWKLEHIRPSSYRQNMRKIGDNLFISTIP